MPFPSLPFPQAVSPLHPRILVIARSPLLSNLRYSPISVIFRSPLSFDPRYLPISGIFQFPLSFDLRYLLISVIFRSPLSSNFRYPSNSVIFRYPISSDLHYHLIPVVKSNGLFWGDGHICGKENPFLLCPPCLVLGRTVVERRWKILALSSLFDESRVVSYRLIWRMMKINVG